MTVQKALFIDKKFIRNSVKNSRDFIKYALPSVVLLSNIIICPSINESGSSILYCARSPHLNLSDISDLRTRIRRQRPAQEHNAHDVIDCYSIVVSSHPYSVT